jgi:hypothetical protein
LRDNLTAAQYINHSEISITAKTHGSFDSREVRRLEPEEEAKDMEDVEAVLREETPLMRKETETYSKMMREHFAKVGKLHERGFSFVQICAACEKSGLLPKNANPHCFRQAFRREHAKLKRREELIELFRGNDTDAEENSGQDKTGKPANVTKGATKPEPAISDPDGEAAAKERVRKITGTVVDTGLGKIINHTDGSFEYN